MINKILEITRREWEMNITSKKQYKSVVNDMISHAFTLNMQDSIEFTGLRLSAVKRYELRYGLLSNGRAKTAFNALIKSRSLKQKDLKMVASQGVVSEIVNAKRDLTVRQINAIAKSFDVNPYIFL